MPGTGLCVKAEVDMELKLILFSIISGGLAGLIYFGGLWYTVRKLAFSAIPHGLLILSMALRLAIVLMAFFMLVRLSWFYLLIALISFILVRQFMIYRIDRERVYPN